MTTVGMATLGLAAALVLNAFEQSLMLFLSPSQTIAKGIGPDQRFRLGGLVEEESVVRAEDGVTVRFRITDRERSIPVRYAGFLPDLFREGQGVVAEGALDDQGVFVASEVLAKHDETYMPREVAEALKESGMWRETEAP